MATPLRSISIDRTANQRRQPFDRKVTQRMNGTNSPMQSNASAIESSYGRLAGPTPVIKNTDSDNEFGMSKYSQYKKELRDFEAERGLDELKLGKQIYKSQKDEEKKALDRANVLGRFSGKPVFPSASEMGKQAAEKTNRDIEWQRNYMSGYQGSRKG
jgi:hypothetical protein